jgi:hypothetical protein
MLLFFHRKGAKNAKKRKNGCQILWIPASAGMTKKRYSTKATKKNEATRRKAREEIALQGDSPESTNHPSGDSVIHGTVPVASETPTPADKQRLFFNQ